MPFVDFSNTAKLPDASNLLDAITKIRSMNQTQDDQQTAQAAGGLSADGDYTGASNLLARAGKLQDAQNVLNYGQTAARRAAYSNYASDPEALRNELLKTGDTDAYKTVSGIKDAQSAAATNKRANPT